MNVKAENINLGHHDARFDPYVIDQFIKSGTYGAVKQGKKNIVIGRKGSGKTSLFKKLIDEANKAGNIVMSYDCQDVYRSEDKLTEAYTALAINLQWDIFLQLAKKVTDHEEKKVFPAEELKRLKQSHSDYLKKLAKFMKEDLTEFSVTPFFSLSKNSMRKTGSFFEKKDLDAFSDSLQACLKAKNAYVLFDDPEFIFTDPEKIEFKIIEALLFAVQELNVRLNPHLKVLVFMQASSYDWLAINFRDIRNIRDFMIPINWSEDELVKLLAERIKKNINNGKDRNEWEYWKFFFDIKRKAEFDKFKDYLFERIVNGPRDILQHCIMAQEAAANQKMNRVSFELLQDIEPAYSKELLDAISQENSIGSYYNGIYHFICNAFHKGKDFYSRSDLSDKLEKDWREMHDDYKDFEWFKYSGTGDKLIEKLYRVGFLGYKKGDDVVFGWQSQDLTAFEKASDFVIRTAYRKALSIS